MSYITYHLSLITYHLRVERQRPYTLHGIYIILIENQCLQFGQGLQALNNFYSVVGEI